MEDETSPAISIEPEARIPLGPFRREPRWRLRGCEACGGDCMQDDFLMYVCILCGREWVSPRGMLHSPSQH